MDLVKGVEKLSAKLRLQSLADRARVELHKRRVMPAHLNLDLFRLVGLRNLHAHVENAVFRCQLT